MGASGAARGGGGGRGGAGGGGGGGRRAGGVCPRRAEEAILPWPDHDFLLTLAHSLEERKK